MKQHKVVIYSAQVCPYCTRAKAYLDSIDIQYQEMLIDQDPDARAQMEEKSSRRTVPQIFIDDKPIGGYDDMMALVKAGTLNSLLYSDQ